MVKAASCRGRASNTAPHGQNCRSLGKTFQRDLSARQCGEKPLPITGDGVATRPSAVPFTCVASPDGHRNGVRIAKATCSPCRQSGYRRPAC